MGEILTTRSAPYDAEIEYLESTGTQWIDTQVVANRTNFKALVCLSLTSLTTQALLASSKTESGLFKRSYVLYYDDGNNLLKMYSTFVNGTWDSNRCASVGQKTINTRYNVEITLTNGNVTLTDLDSGIFSTKLADTPPNVTLGLGANNNPDGILAPSFAKFYSCKLYSSGTLVRDFIPVRVGQTGYLYDRVSQTLFGNQGSGNFKLGKDIHWTKTLNTRIKNRYDTEENWLTENPILLSGETAFTDISGVHKCKVGDGETPYIGLPYVNNMDEAMIIRKWRD